MTTQKIEACFATAEKLIFDNVKKDVKAPNVIALVFSEFDDQLLKVATYLKAVAGIHEMVMVLETYMDGLAIFSLVNKVQESTYTSSFHLCSKEEFALLQNQAQAEKVIFTFYRETAVAEQGLLHLEDETPFFLYLPCYVQSNQYQRWNAV